jgi:pimeloyl-ACP methyl ester carboxylesterase
MSEAGHGVNRRSAVKRTALVTAIAGAAYLGFPAAAAAERDSGPVPIPPQMPMREGTVDVGGATLWYWDTGGTGPTVVLAHPASGSGLNWPYQQPVFAKAGYRVIGYSRRGAYGSSPLDPASPGIASEDLRILVDKLGLARFHLIGIAAGGFTALDFAVSYPDRLRKLVIACSILSLQEPEFVAIVSSLRPPEFDTLPIELKELSPAYRASNPDGVTAWLELHDKATVPGSSGRQGTANQITWAHLAALTVPTLLIAGDADLYMPPPLTRMAAAHFAHARTAVISEAGHAVHWEQPRAFNSTVLDFL